MLNSREVSYRTKQEQKPYFSKRRSRRRMKRRERERREREREETEGEKRERKEVHAASTQESAFSSRHRFHSAMLRNQNDS